MREALGARAVIRVCSSHDPGRVAAAAYRLIDNAAAIRATVDLSGAGEAGHRQQSTGLGHIHKFCLARCC